MLNTYAYMHKVDIILRKADINFNISPDVFSCQPFIMGQNYIHTRLRQQLPDLALFETTTDGRTVYTDNKVYATTDSGSEYLLVTYVINYLTN